MDTPDLRDEANLPPLVHDLLAEGRAVLDAERREKEMREEAAAGARRALVKVNLKTAADALVQLEPKAARLMPWADVVERDGDANVPAEFWAMEFEFKLPGFLPVRVWVRRTVVLVAGPPTRHEGSPWKLGEFCVLYHHNSTAHPYPSLGVALARAREQWLKENKDGDVPF